MMKLNRRQLRSMVLNEIKSLNEAGKAADLDSAIEDLPDGPITGKQLKEVLQMIFDALYVSNKRPAGEARNIRNPASGPED